MKNKYEVFIVALVILLPGCGGNVVDWGKKSFAQGGVYQDTHTLIQSYMRDVKVYDMFDTLGSFDVLWLSDEVRTLYTQLHATMFGKTEDSQGIFLRRQLKANTQHLVFYVLAGKNISLSKKPIVWAMYLDIDGKKYQPVEVKQTDLPVQYQMFFGKRLTSHKQAYEIKFDRNDTESLDILDGTQEHRMKLKFNGPIRYGYVAWDVKQAGVVVGKTPSGTGDSKK